jgi:hypothetical protein
MQTRIQKELKSIRIVYIALIMAIATFLTFAIVLKYIGFTGTLEGDMISFQAFQFTSFLIGISSIGGGIYIFNKRIKAINTENLTEKILKYREAMIIRGASIEGASLFFISAYFLFQHDFFIIAALIGLGFLGFFFPTNSRIAKELNIEDRELKE